MLHNPFAKRIERLRAAMEEMGVDAYLAGAKTSLGYLCGFKEQSLERLLLLGVHTTKDPVLFCPALSGQGAQNNPAGVEDIRLWADGSDPRVPLRHWFKQWNLESGIIGVDDEMPAGFLLMCQEVLPAALFRHGSGVMSRVRRKKDPDELALLERAAAITDGALSAAFEACRIGHTEKSIALAIQHAVHEVDAELAFETIVGSGPNSALPHHHTGDRRLKQGDVIILDFGANYAGYNGDITRTVCLGEASEEIQEIYKVVWDAHYAAREIIRPGVPAQQIDAAARKVIEQAGYGEYFIHRTGHGIGLQAHEAPYIVKGDETLLEEGMCFSVEPGIYLPGRFGIRIENIVSVTAGGHRSLNAEPAQHIRELVV